MGSRIALAHAACRADDRASPGLGFQESGAASAMFSSAAAADFLVDRLPFG